MNKKGIKTTVVAFVGLAILLAIVGMYLFGKIDTNQLTVALSSVGTILGVVIGFLAKDQDKSHGFDPRAGVTPPPGNPPGNDPDK